MAMTNREMVMADFNLFEIADIESRRRARFNAVDFLFTDTPILSLDDDDDPAEDDDSPGESLLNFNPDNHKFTKMRNPFVVNSPLTSPHLRLRIFASCEPAVRFVSISQMAQLTAATRIVLFANRSSRWPNLVS